MKSKNLIGFVLILIILVAGGVLLYKNQPASLKIQDTQITDNTPPFKIAITYPQIAGVNDFNKLVKDIVDQEIKDFKTNSLNNDAAVKKTDPVDYAKYPREYDLNIGYDKGEVDNNIISVVLNIYNFEGGAHGASYSRAVNYNPQTQKEIKLADLFPGQTNYLQKISDYCIKDLKNQMTKSGAIDMSGDDWLAEGAGPTEKNYSVFLINKNNITFYFGDYQVAAYAAGDFKVTMPR